MAEEGFKRKLAAILSADVEGYSRLMGEDKEYTVRTLSAYREVFTTLIVPYKSQADRENYISALRQAGLPE